MTAAVIASHYGEAEAGHRHHPLCPARRDAPFRSVSRAVGTRQKLHELVSRLRGNDELFSVESTLPPGAIHRPLSRIRRKSIFLWEFGIH
jgi:hypothetical protein